MPIISKKEVNLAFDVIIEKIPAFAFILDNIKIDVSLIKKTSIDVNSATAPTAQLNRFSVFCYCMREENLSPIYVFLHEIGHIIGFIVTQNFSEVPASFFAEIGKYFNKLEPDNPDALEVFADCFAMSIMHNTKLSIYNPFTRFDSSLFDDLDKYFTNLINVTIHSPNKE